MADHGQPGAGPPTIPPLVTVGMPVRNGAAHLAEAVESVLAQDYPSLEVVICDNASDDATPSIARELASRDGRVRYERNPQDIGLLPNFARVRDLARGRYFTWLGHDDLLSDPSYLSSTVGYLEQHPETGLCHTAIRLLKPGGESEVVEFPELAPGRPWEAARRDLFDWPQDWLEMCSHGVFRLEALAPLAMPERTGTGRPYVFCWEIGVLTALALRWRIVALPQPLRTYRSSAGSAARLLGRNVSPFDLWLLDLETKLNLVRRAWAAPGDPAARARLVATALGNLPEPTFRRRFDHRYATRLAERELAMLLRTAAERRSLLERLEAEVAARRRLLQERGAALNPPARTGPPNPAHGSGGALAGAAEILAGSTAGNRLRDLFRPPSAAAVARFAELNDGAAGLRLVCDELLDAIDLADAEAAALQAAVDAAG